MDCELELVVVDLSCSLDVVGLRGTGLRVAGLLKAGLRGSIGLGVVLVPLGVPAFFSDGGPSMARAFGGGLSIASLASGAGRASLGGEGGVRT